MFVCCRFRNKDPRDFVQCVCWNPLSYELASCSWDGTLMCRAVTSDSNSHSIASDNVADFIAMNDQ